MGNRIHGFSWQYEISSFTAYKITAQKAPSEFLQQ